MVGSNVLVVGAGMAGCVISRVLAERGMNVSLCDKRSHIGGNAYDFIDSDGIAIQKYGPHIFHTNSTRVYDFLSRFTDWFKYEHRVAAMVDGTLMPLPFNFTSLKMAFGEKRGEAMAEKLLKYYSGRESVPIFELKECADADIRVVADYVYKTVFETYTKKQWGKYAEDVLSVTARVPVVLSYDDRYFHDTYQAIPLNGFTKMFENMIDCPRLKLSLSDNVGADEIFSFDGTVIYTGALDALFSYCYGRLPYRTLDFEFERVAKPSFQPYATVNYTVSEKFTRITEFRHFTAKSAPATTILREYPRDAEGDDIPCYSINNPFTAALYERYARDASQHKNLRLLGRLAEYKYYNMDVVCEKALSLSDALLGALV